VFPQITADGSDEFLPFRLGYFIQSILQIKKKLPSDKWSKIGGGAFPSPDEWYFIYLERI
jgi:hypothetical protein